MRTYYSFTIFAEPACELNTNQKNDLQTQSAFCQVCLLVSGQSTFFWAFFSRLCNQYLLRNDQRMSKIPQSAKGS